MLGMTSTTIMKPGSLLSCLLGMVAQTQDSRNDLPATSDGRVA